MGLKILDRKYTNAYTDEPTDWLLGNTGDVQKMNLICKVSAESKLSDENKIQFEYPNKIKSISGTKWNHEGFDVGDSIIINFDILTDDVYTTFYESSPLVILEILDTEMILDSDGSDFPVGSNSLPAEFTNTSGVNKRWENARIYTDKRPEGLELFYNHLENADSDSFNLNSFIDGSLTKLRSIGLDTAVESVWQDMETIGFQSGMSVFQPRIRFVGSGDAGDSFGDYELTSQTTRRLNVRRLGHLYTNWDSYQDKESRSIPITINNPLDSSVKSQEEGLVGMTSVFEPGIVDYRFMNSDYCFVNNSQTTYNTDIDFDFAIRHNSTNVGTGNIRLVLMKFQGSGSTKLYESKQIIKDWGNSYSLAGTILSFNGIFNATIEAGKSYSIVVEFEKTNSEFQPKYVDYTTINSKISLIDPSGSGNNGGDTEDHEYLYEIELYYIISSFFEDISTFQDPIIQPSVLFDANSLTDNFKIVAFPEVNNPNILIENDMNFTKQLGNTGWFNENFDGLDNDFVVESVQYFDLNGNPFDQIDYTQPVKVRIEVSGIQNISSETECGFGFSWIPTKEEDYKSNLRPYHENTFVSVGGQFSSFNVGTTYPNVYPGFGYDGINIVSEHPSFTESSGNMVFECIFRPTPEFMSHFENKDENDRNYILWLSVADHTLQTNFSNRVSLLCDFNNMEKTIPPAGLYEDIENLFFEHGEDTSFPGLIEYDGFVEDDVLCHLPFRIDISQDLTFRKMTFGVQARKVSTGERFVLQNLPVDLTSFVTDSNGVQQFDFDSIRGFKLVNGNNKNWVKIQRDDMADVGSSKAYNAYFAMKIRWEDWLSRADVPVDFYDNTELNDGFNNDWYHYINTTDYEIDFFVLIDVLRDGILQQHKNVWKFNFNDYDSNDLVNTDIKYFRNSDNTDITQPPVGGVPQGVILDTEFTRIEISYTRADASTWDLSNSYAVTTLEIENGAGQFEHRQIGSVWLTEPDNPLKPIPGQTKLFLSLHDNDETLKATCLIDPALLENVARYKVTGRVGCFDGGFVPSGGLYEDLYEDVYE